jgi:thioredoxin reductase (NADPH)
MDNNINDVIIIGSGPAGLTAAIYLARADLKPLVFMGLEFGGQLMNTTEIENFPGFPEGIDGPVLMQNMIKQAERFGSQLVYNKIESVDFSKPIKELKADDGKTYYAKSVIVATGATPLKLNVSGEVELWGKGVSACATCDGAFYRNKIVAVVGGGDTAMEEASFLTRFASKVYLIHRRNEFRASKSMQKEVFENEKIEVIWNTTISKINGEKFVETLTLKNTESGEEKELPVNGIFLAIGHIPTTKFLEGQIELDEKGYIQVNNNTRTNIDGVFVAGDVRDSLYKQAITAAGMGCMSALDCEKWLTSHQ